MGREQEQQSDPVIAAIERVLRAERDGVVALRESEDRATRLSTEARTQAASIAARADARISRLHTAYLRKIEADIGTLTAANAIADSDAERGPDPDLLAEATRRFAAKLTGGT